MVPGLPGGAFRAWRPVARPEGWGPMCPLPAPLPAPSRTGMHKAGDHFDYPKDVGLAARPAGQLRERPGGERLGCAVTGWRPPLRRWRNARPLGPCLVDFTGSTVDQPPVVHFRGGGLHADFARVEVDLIPALVREFTEPQAGESRKEQKRLVALPHAGRHGSNSAAAGPAQSASRPSAVLNPRGWTDQWADSE